MPFGWTVVYDKFPAILSAMDLKVAAVVTKAAMDIQANAQTAAPVDTGILRTSIQATRKGKHSWEVLVGADYGVYVEYGTHKAGAQPYFGPAIDKVRPQFLAAMKRVL